MSEPLPPHVNGSQPEPERVIVAAHIEHVPTVKLTACACGIECSSDHPEALQAVRLRKDFEVPCQCGRMLVVEAPRIVRASKVPH